MPESNVHKGDAELGGHQDHSHYHNVLLAKIWELFLLTLMKLDMLVLDYLISIFY